MTITHEATPVAEPAPEPRPKKAKKAKVRAATTEPVPAPEPSEQPAKTEKRAKPKKAPKGPAPSMTLAELAEHYLAHLQATKSAGTALSYKMELDRAVDYLGADTTIGSLTPDDILRFNGSRLVMCKKDGKTPKAAPSYLKTQRVLRLALVWAAEQGWIETAPIPADADSK